jgi:hypothetical protein
VKKSFAVVVILLVAVCTTCFTLTWRNRTSEAEARAFCEKLFPRLEETRAKQGKFPEAIDASWLQGISVPRLIHLDDFYEGHQDYFDFHFRNRWNLFDTLFVYNSRVKVWLIGD